MLEIVQFTLGPASTNAYLVADPETKEAVVIDPSWDGHIILGEAQKRGWRIGHMWYTHAHFDHIGGAAAIADALNPLPHVALHPDDHVLWREGGGGKKFGLDIDPGPEPTIDLVHGMTMKLGSNEFEVRFTPGHTRGHCVLYVAKENICFCGDLIFNESVGRTDLPGGDFETLEKSIREQIYTMPDETLLLSGHGPQTTVGHEKKNNPFVSE
ncbi:MAG: MBL fold metallo-hydrolase [Anaerolineae bacterium]|nr:MBL fold metallo-hydrolase [Anaerolineae bacterium]